MRCRNVPVGAMLCLAACGRGAAGASADASGLATVIDSTGDSVVARVTGAVPAAAVRHLVEEFRIAPAADDTTLFTDIGDVEVDRLGRLWVFDRPTNSIFLFGADGHLIRRVGRQGGGPGEYRQAGGMVALSDGGLALWDPSNARVSFLDSSGTFRTSWPLPGGFATNDGLLRDTSGVLYLKRPVTPPREGEILGRLGLVRLREGGAFGDSLVPPDLDVPRELYVATRVNGGNRSQSSTSSRFAPNYYWGWHPEGRFVVAHGGRGEIVVAAAGGKALVIRRETPAVPIAGEERDEEKARITYAMRRTDPGWTWSGPPIPEVKAPISGLFLAADGRIWVTVPVPSEPVPAEDQPVRRDSLAPVMHYRTPLVYEVYSSSGRFLGRIAFPGRTRLVEARDNFVWAIVRDADDLPAVVRFRVEPGLP